MDKMFRRTADEIEGIVNGSTQNSSFSVKSAKTDIGGCFSTENRGKLIVFRVLRRRKKISWMAVKMVGREEDVHFKRASEMMY